MNKTQLKSNLILMLAAAIWGFAFVAQRVGSEYVGAFTFNGIRFLIGSLSLIPVIILLKCKSAASKKYILKAGLIAGIFLFLGANIQQIGIAYTTAGKSAFLTSFYTVLVPLFLMFYKEKTDINTWIGIFLTVPGLYFLCVNEQFVIEKGDIIVFICAFFWAFHVISVGRYVRKVNPVTLSAIQFFVCGVLSLLFALILREPISFELLKGAALPVAYGGFLSAGVGFTLQVVGQKGAKSSHAAIIMSLESVFGAIGGMLLLNEQMSVKGFLGCAMIFAGVIFSQIRKEDKKGNE